MTELKSDSQSIRTVQTQPSSRKRSPKSTSAATPEVAATGETEPESEEAAPKPKRRTTKTTASKTKRQATNKTPKQVSSTQVKLAWEPSQSSIAARFAQLEHDLQHYKNEVTSILSEMDELKALSQQFESKEAQRTGRLKLPLETPQKVQESDSFGVVPSVNCHSVPSQPGQPREAIPLGGIPSDRTTEVTENPSTSIYPKVNPRVEPLAPRFESARFPSSEVDRLRSLTAQRQATQSARVRSRRRFTLDKLIKRCLTLPDQHSGVAIDAALWVLAAAGLRIGLKYLAFSVPILAAPVNILLFVPALVAVYSALFMPQVNRVGIYRLLLVTMGLFVGGKL